MNESSIDENMLNETYLIKDKAGVITKFRLEIFNRLGQIVFRVKNYENDWDGTNSYSSGLFSNQLTTGTYFYVFRTINAVSVIGDREYKGYIYINR